MEMTPTLEDALGTTRFYDLTNNLSVVRDNATGNLIYDSAGKLNKMSEHDHNERQYRLMLSQLARFDERVGWVERSDTHRASAC
jgi:hypothetical protein